MVSGSVISSSSSSISPSSRSSFVGSAVDGGGDVVGLGSVAGEGSSLLGSCCG